MQKRKRGRLARPGCADEGDRFAGQRGEAEIRDCRALAVIGERHVLEFHEPAHVPGIHGISAVAHRRLGVEHVEEFGKPRGIHHNLVGKMNRLVELADQERCEAHEHDDFADAGLAAQVEPDSEHENRKHCQRGGRAGNDRRHRPPRQDRDLCSEHFFAHLPHSRDFRLDAGEALHQSNVSKRIAGAFGHVRVVALDRALQLFDLAHDQRDHHAKDRAQQDQ